MTARELNAMRVEGGWLDWSAFADPVKARAGDSLTLESIEDIGPETVRPMQILDTIIKRGVVVDSSAICPDPHQLAGIHAKHRDRQRQRRAAEASRGNDGRPEEYSDDDVRKAWDAIRNGTVTPGEVAAVFGISKSTMSRRCARLGLDYPPTFIDSSQQASEQGEK